MCESEFMDCSKLSIKKTDYYEVSTTNSVRIISLYSCIGDWQPDAVQL